MSVAPDEVAAAAAEVDDALRAAVTFATTEHFTLQTARSSTVTEAGSRGLGFLAVLSSSLIALAFAGQMSSVGTAFYAFALVLLPALGFVGLVTFQRLVQLTNEDIAFAERIARLREFYVAAAPGLEAYLTVLRGPAPPRGRPPGPSAWQLLLTIAGTVAIVNSVVVGAVAGIIGAASTGGSLAAALAAGVPAGVAALLFHLRHQRRARERRGLEQVDALAVTIPPPAQTS